MASLKDRVTAPVREARERVPVLDHVVRTIEHYGKHNGSLYAAGVTLAAFLSVFPLLGLAFAVVGFIARVLPPGLDAEQTLVEAINGVLPGIVQVPGEKAVTSPPYVPSGLLPSPRFCTVRVCRSPSVTLAVTT